MSSKTLIFSDDALGGMLATCGCHRGNEAPVLPGAVLGINRSLQKQPHVVNVESEAEGGEYQVEGFDGGDVADAHVDGLRSGPAQCLARSLPPVEEAESEARVAISITAAIAANMQTPATRAILRPRCCKFVSMLMLPMVPN